ncbi:MAG: hypothetical protein ACLP4R_29140 [Solirubrobacteraceae bacterium]
MRSTSVELALRADWHALNPAPRRPADGLARSHPAATPVGGGDNPKMTDPAGRTDEAFGLAAR